MSTTHISDMVKKHTKRAHSADKASSFKRRDQQSNSELLADSHIPTSISNTAQTATTNQETFKAEPNNIQNTQTNKVENRESTAEGYSARSYSARVFSTECYFSTEFILLFFSLFKSH